jgi:hypothetical protein
MSKNLDKFFWFANLKVVSIKEKEVIRIEKPKGALERLC